MTKAAEDAREKLMKYYNKVTPLYCIVSALDPRINLEYFRKEDWEERFINDWRSKMEEIWEHYKPKDPFIIATKPVDDDVFFSSIYKKRQRTMPRDELEQLVFRKNIS